MFGEKIYTEPVPARVYALYKAAKKYDVSQNELKELMEPPALSSGTSYFSRILEAAKELQLVDIQENKVCVIAEIKDNKDFKDYCRKTVSSMTDSQYFEVTNCICEMNTEILHFKSLSGNDLISTINSKVSHPVDENNMRGWRLWVDVLGLGSIFEASKAMEYLPNAAGLITTAMRFANFRCGDVILIDDFIQRITPVIRLAGKNDTDNRKFNYCISNGLRFLNDTGIITLQHKQDQAITWQLYNLRDDSSYSEPISSIIIGGLK